MKFEYSKDKETASLIYKQKDVFTSKGMSGGPILALDEHLVTLIGVHNGTEDEQGFGSLNSNNGKCDDMINFIENNVKEFNETQSDRNTYMNPLIEFKKQNKDIIDEREFHRETT